MVSRAQDDFDLLLEQTNNLGDISWKLAAAGYAQFEINLALKTKLDQGFDVVVVKGQSYLAVDGVI